MAGKHSKKSKLSLRLPARRLPAKPLDQSVSHEAWLPRKPFAKPTIYTAHLDAMWNWYDLILIGVTLVIAYFVSSNVMSTALAQLLPGSGQAVLRLVLVLVFYVVEILVVAYIAHRHNYKFSRLYRLRAEGGEEDEDPLARWLRDFGTAGAWVLGLLLATRGFGLLWSLLTAQWGWVPKSSTDILTIFGEAPSSLWLSVVIVVVLAPFIEEIIFRGVFLSTFQMMTRTSIAITAAAVIFAVYHASLWSFVPHVVAGLAMGYLAVTRKTLWPAIILHALYNAILIYAAYSLL